jgi:hypothetical protein
MQRVAGDALGAPSTTMAPARSMHRAMPRVARFITLSTILGLIIEFVNSHIAVDGVRTFGAPPRSSSRLGGV